MMQLYAAFLESQDDDDLDEDFYGTYWPGRFADWYCGGGAIIKTQTSVK